MFSWKWLYAGKAPELDLGFNHYLRWVAWVPEDTPALRVRYNVPVSGPMPRVQRVGAIIRHILPTPGLCPLCKDRECEHYIALDNPELWEWMNPSPVEHLWTIVEWHPLTLIPTIACHCGDRGRIKKGKWLPAP